nr:uncharacterized protein CFP56_59708 [Quercus suber]
MPTHPILVQTSIYWHSNANSFVKSWRLWDGEHVNYVTNCDFWPVPRLSCAGTRRLLAVASADGRTFYSRHPRSDAYKATPSMMIARFALVRPKDLTMTALRLRGDRLCQSPLTLPTLDLSPAMVVAAVLQSKSNRRTANTSPMIFDGFECNDTSIAMLSAHHLFGALMQHSIAKPEGAVHRSYCGEPRDCSINSWGERGRTKLHNSRHAFEPAIPSYRPSSKHDRVTREHVGADVGTSRSAGKRDLDATYGTDSDWSDPEHAQKAVSQRAVPTQRDVTAHRGRVQSARSLQTDKQERSPYPDRSLKPMRQRKVRISDHKAVTEFFESRLKDMQQLATKKIAKAWIKGICPRKQALFPYQDSSRRRDSEDPNIPEWWPRPEFCSFREPDHIKKEGKLASTLHFREVVC